MSHHHAGSGSSRAARKSVALRYRRATTPLSFPERQLMPEGKTHLTLRTFPYQLLRFALGPSHSVGSEQFVYWNAADPRRCLAPDAFVKLHVPDAQFGTWKTWERGAPDLAVEIVSPSEGDGIDWEEKLARYFECGVQELVRFDPEAPAGERLRVWDRVDGDLVERTVEDSRTPCLTLDLEWVIGQVDVEPVGLRLADAAGALVLDAREAETKAREAAEARVRELEAVLASRG